MIVLLHPSIHMSHRLPCSLSKKPVDVSSSKQRAHRLRSHSQLVIDTRRAVCLHGSADEITLPCRNQCRDDASASVYFNGNSLVGLSALHRTLVFHSPTSTRLLLHPPPT